MRVDIRLDTSDLDAAIVAHARKLPGVIRRCLDRAGVSGRTAMAKLISEDTGLPSSRVKKAIIVTRVGDSGIALSASRLRLPLIDFQARGPEPSRGRGRGVSYRLPSGRGRIPNAFIATMKSGHRGVYKRFGSGRLPIIELRGPSIGHVFEKFLPQGQAAGEESLRKNMKHEISFALKR